MTFTQWKALGLLTALGVAFVGGMYAQTSGWGRAATATATVTHVLGQPTQPADVDMAQFWTAYQILNQNFVQTHSSSTFPTTEKQIWGAIEGLADSFGDPYTVFMPPSDAQLFQENISGSFGGVGMEIDNNTQGQVIVVSPLKNSPAARAGIRSGDIVLTVGTTTLDGMTSTEAVKIIRGPVGTSVSLTIARPGEAKPLSFTIVRETINIPIINSYKRDDGIFVIELYSFSENSTNLFRDALRQFVQSGSTKLLLDLRGNPGGYLDAAVSMASYFLRVGDVIVTEDFAGKQQNQAHTSYGYNVFANNKSFKMAILVDQGSASASEILAGALSQQGVAKLIGTRTFGKGSVQQLIDLGGGAQLKVTIARWLTPNGKSISDGGLTPDIKVERTNDDYKAGKDPQTDAAVIYLLNN